MKFSLILNSRKRPQLLKNLLNSIEWQTRDISNIEVLISSDQDDSLTKNLNFPDFCSIEYIERDQNLHRRMNNLIKNTTGKYIIPLNDDCEIITKDWDEQCWNILETYKDNIIYGRTQCTSVDKENGGQYASFPIIGRHGIDILNQFITEQLPGLGGDVFLYRIYSQINRIIDVPLKIRHLLHENISNIINCDKVALDMREGTQKAGINCWTINIDNEINKLKYEIQNINKT